MSARTPAGSGGLGIGLLVGDRHVGQPPHITAVHPPRTHPALWARHRPVLDPHRLPGPEDLLDHNAGQVRQQDIESFKIARTG